MAENWNSEKWDAMRKAKEGSYFAKKNQELLDQLHQKKVSDKRPSPITGEEMEQVVLSGVTIDRCPSSGGIWLDEGELEQLLAAALAEDLEAKKTGEKEGSGIRGFFRGTGQSRGQMSTKPSKKLEFFPNPAPERDYEIAFACPEFTCLCPKTGQPDFANFMITYIPDELCVELKSLKLYMWSFRDEGHFHEAVTNRILDDIVETVDPRYVEVAGDFFVRGGISTVVRVEYYKDSDLESDLEEWEPDTDLEEEPH